MPHSGPLPLVLSHRTPLARHRAAVLSSRRVKIRIDDVARQGVAIVQARPAPNRFWPGAVVQRWCSPRCARAAGEWISGGVRDDFDASGRAGSISWGNRQSKTTSSTLQLGRTPADACSWKSRHFSNFSQVSARAELLDKGLPWFERALSRGFDV